jgi:hypothetical protein
VCRIIKPRNAFPVIRDLKLAVASPFYFIVADNIEKSSGAYIAALKLLIVSEDISTIHQPVWRSISLTATVYLFTRILRSRSLKTLLNVMGAPENISPPTNGSIWS